MHVFWVLLRRYRVHFALLIALGFISGLLEGIGITAIIPLFAYLVGQDIPGGNKIAHFVVDIFNYLPVPYSPVSLLVLIVILFIIRALVLVCFYYLRSRVSSSYMVRTMNDLWGKVLRAKWGYLLKQRLGTFDVTISRDVRMGQSLLENVSQIVLIFTNLVIYISLAIYISLPITIAAAFAGALLIGVLSPLRKRMKKTLRGVGVMEKDISHFLNEHTLGMKTVKSAAAEPAVFAAGLKWFDSLKRLLIKTTLFSSVGTSMTQPIALIFIAGVFLFFYGKGTLQLGTFIALIYLIQKIFMYVESAQSALHGLHERLPYVEHTLEFARDLELNQEETGGDKPFGFASSVDFKDVELSYEAREAVLKGVSFSIPKGRLVGLIGPSGAGKTSIADLLLKLFKPTSGAILVDGEDAGHFDTSSWRRAVGYVSQDMFLLNDTIENNIRFYDTSSTSEDIQRAAKLANCHEFVDKLPQGMQTVIGERGLLLSAGQRQRVILARVLARKPNLLILDEATSALDNESERLVQEAIENLKNQVTVFMIAHRLSTVMNVDHLLVLQDGRIEEQGTPQKLLSDPDSYFSRMYKK